MYFDAFDYINWVYYDIRDRYLSLFTYNLCK